MSTPKVADLGNMGNNILFNSHKMYKRTQFISLFVARVTFPRHYHRGRTAVESKIPWLPGHKCPLQVSTATPNTPQPCLCNIDTMQVVIW